MFERRQHFRRRTLLDGRLEIDKLNGWALACSVRNLSDGGARIAIPGDIVVPQNVGLAVSGQPRRPARLVWYRDGHAGFALIDAQPADVTTAEDVAPHPSDAPVAAASRDRLAARLAAIGAGRRRRGHFTRP